MATRPCTHRQAEPVVLSTGEHVACVCVECFYPLPEIWIDQQRCRAEREAFCEHDEQIEISAFGVAERSHICRDCGAML